MNPQEATQIDPRIPRKHQRYANIQGPGIDMISYIRLRRVGSYLFLLVGDQTLVRFIKDSINCTEAPKSELTYTHQSMTNVFNLYKTSLSLLTAGLNLSSLKAYKAL